MEKKQRSMAFADRVYGVTRRIPRGRVATYKDIAIALHSKAYRAVGNALNKNPFAPKVPCHRVIASSGELGGFARGIQQKEEMLRKEGVIIANKRINLQKFGCKLK